MNFFNIIREVYAFLISSRQVKGGIWLCGYIPYFFAYKTVFFSFQNNPKNLDPSYKTDLDLWDCLGRVKPVLQQN